MYQKAESVSTLILSRWWFNSQAVKIDPNFCKRILNQAKVYIYKNCDEKPVDHVNYRPVGEGGLNIHHPLIKHKELLIKNMLRKTDRDEREHVNPDDATVDHSYAVSSSHAVLSPLIVSSPSQSTRPPIYGYGGERQG